MADTKKEIREHQHRLANEMAAAAGPIAECIPMTAGIVLMAVQDGPAGKFISGVMGKAPDAKVLGELVRAFGVWVDAQTRTSAPAPAAPDPGKAN